MENEIFSTSEYEIMTFLNNLAIKYGKEIMLDVIQNAVFTYKTGDYLIKMPTEEDIANYRKEQKSEGE